MLHWLACLPLLFPLPAAVGARRGRLPARRLRGTRTAAAGAALDQGRITTGAGIGVGLAVTAARLAAAVLPGVAGVLIAAVLIGLGTGVITPLGSSAPASATPPERLGQTMGAAELGRELGDAGGPLIVAGVAAATVLSGGFAALAILTATASLTLRRPRHRQDRGPAPTDNPT